MKPHKCLYGIACWLFVVPKYGFIILCNAKVENRLADKQHPFPNMFQPEIREEKERDAAISVSDFTSGICIFQPHTGHFPALLVPVLFGNGCPGAGRLSREETARLMSAASTAMDSNDLFTVTN